MEGIICPNCGSSDCSVRYLTANNAKIAGKALLGGVVGGVFGGVLLGGKEFLDSDKNKDEFECNDCGNIFTRKQSIASQKKRDSRIEKINRLYDQKQYKSVIQECDKLLVSDCDEEEQYKALLSRACANKALAEQSAEKWEATTSKEERKRISYEEIAPYRFSSISDFEALIKTFGDDPDFFYELSYAYYELPVFTESQKFDYLSRRYAIASLDTDDNKVRPIYQDWFESLNKKILSDLNLSECSDEEERECLAFQQFANDSNEYIPFSDRQFIMFAKSDDKMAGYHDPDDNIKWVFSVNNYPNDIKIEGLPQPNILYMANPVKKDTYLPYENAEEILFQSKVREFEYLVGCLGATSIRFRSLKGKKVSSEREVDRSAGAEVDFKAVGGGLNTNWGSKENRNTNTSSELGRNQKLNPTKYPFIPEGLGWYNLVEEWRDFARQRLQNGLTYYKYTFKSSESSSLSTQKKLDISASFKKMALSINAHYSQNIKESIAIQEETEWEVEVDFKPLEEFANQSDNAKKSGFAEIPVSNATLNDNEQFYYDELQDVLADGVITENDRKRLERRRQRLNISEERAKEIEQMLSPSLTDDEQEYYDELFEVLDDGVIDDKERRSLDRLKRSLGISDSRAKEIEDMAFAKRGLK